MVDGLVEELRDVVVVEAVDDAAALPGAGDKAEVAQQPQLVFMIVASPCAVVLATMPPLLAAIANAGRHGVLAKSAVVMEQLGATTLVALDKTGTLTHGAPELTEIQLLPGAGLGQDELLRLVASAEHPSEHPVGAAIVRAARHRGLDLAEASEFRAQPGRGVAARVADHLVQAGSPAAFLTGANPHPDAAAAAGTAAAAVGRLRRRGHTAVVVLIDSRPVGVLGIRDRTRAEAPAAVAALARLTGAAPVLLTGDNSTTAARLAGEVGITDVRAELLPEDKVTAVGELRAAGHRVTVVGDGINDAPALASADTGIAMGGAGSDLTLRAADAVVVRDDLSTIPAVIALARRARRVVTANLVIAGVFIAGLVIWDLAGTLPLPLGVAGHEGSTIIVGLNGLRLLRRAAWHRATRSGQ